MITFTTALSGRELGESVIFQPVLQAYSMCHSWIIMAHVSLDTWNIIGKLLTDNLLGHTNYYISKPATISTHSAAINTAGRTHQH